MNKTLRLILLLATGYSLLATSSRAAQSIKDFTMSGNSTFSGTITSNATTTGGTTNNSTIGGNTTLSGNLTSTANITVSSGTWDLSLASLTFAANQISWATVSKSGSSLADLTTRSASDLTSGTLPDARFPATLPAVNGSLLTNLNASNLASGTVPDARFPATLPALNGSLLTNLNASNLASGTVPTARLYTTAVGYNITNGAALDALGAVASNGLLQRTAANTYSVATVSSASGISWSAGTLSLSAIPNTSLANSTITIAGSSTALGGTITASTILDSVGSTRGSINYRGASGWSSLTPGTSNFALVSQGAGADPVYAAVVNSITGTANQITASSSTGAVTLSITTNPTLPGNVTVGSNLTVTGLGAFGAGLTGASPGEKATIMMTTAGLNFMAFGAGTNGGRSSVKIGTVASMVANSSFASEVWFVTDQGNSSQPGTIATTDTTEATTGGAGSIKASGGIYAAKAFVSSSTTASTSTTSGSIITGGGIGAGGAIFGGDKIVSVGATAGIGYATGAGGTVTQATSRTTGVTLNKVTGEITLFTTTLAADTTQSFTLTNSAIAAGDLVEVKHVSGGTLGIYKCDATAASGSATIYVRNISPSTSASEAPVLKFVVIKATTS